MIFSLCNVTSYFFHYPFLSNDKNHYLFIIYKYINYKVNLINHFNFKYKV